MLRLFKFKDNKVIYKELMMEEKTEIEDRSKKKNDE